MACLPWSISSRCASTPPNYGCSIYSILTTCLVHGIPWHPLAPLSSSAGLCCSLHRHPFFHPLPSHFVFPSCRSDQVRLTRALPCPTIPPNPTHSFFTPELTLPTRLGSSPAVQPHKRDTNVSGRRLRSPVIIIILTTNNTPVPSPPFSHTQDTNADLIVITLTDLYHPPSLPPPLLPLRSPAWTPWSPT